MIGPVVQWIVRKSPELDIPVRFWTGLLLLNKLYNLKTESIKSGCDGF